MRVKLVVRWFYVITVIVLCACSADDEDGVIGTGEKPSAIKGVAQKGPFVKDSEVIINPLTAQAEATDTTINTKTTDDLGSFDFSASNEELFDIIIHGIHFNELSGSLSTQAISLHAIYAKTADDNKQVYVNVLTHLINQRVRYLIQNGSSTANAFVTAQDELLFFIHDALYIVDIDTINFTNLSVYNIANTDELGNALLLYVTSALYQTATSRSILNNSDVDLELALLLDNIAAELKTDGKVTDLTLIEDLRQATYRLDPEKITDNLIQYSIQILGTALSVPDINLVMDTDRDGINNATDTDDDGDGIIDIDDNSPYKFEILTVQNETFSVTAATYTPLSLSYNRPEKREFFILITNHPLNGSLYGIQQNIRYLSTAPAGYSGVDEFSYQVVSLDPLLGDYYSEVTVIKLNIIAAP